MKKNSSLVAKKAASLLLSAIAVVIIIGVLGLHIGPIVPIAFSLIFGGSMFPETRSGDVAILISKNIDQIRVGDIVVFKQGEMYISHRVVSINSTHVITKGDNNEEEDPPVPLSKVLFKVALRIPIYIWPPLVGLVVSLAIVYVYVRSAKGGLRVLKTTSLVIVLSISIMSLSMANYALPGIGYSKPVEIPQIVKIYTENSSLAIQFGKKIDGQVVCTKVNEPVSCTLNGDKIIVDGIDQGIVIIRIRYSNTPYNLSILYSVYVGRPR